MKLTRPAQERSFELPAKCSGCPCGDSFIFVPDSGPEQTEFAIVGEGPGDQERFEKKPFVGPAGKLLWANVAQAGLRREQVFVTNTVSCYIHMDAKKTNYPLAAAKCRQDLIERLQFRDVKYVLALGNEALEALTGDRSITKNQGRVYDVGGMKVIACVHPAALLRSGTFASAGFTQFAKTIKLWALGCRTVEPRATFKDYRVIDDPREAVEFFRRDMKGTMYAVVDIETSGHDLDNDGILCLVISRGEADATVLSDEALNEEALNAWREIAPAVKWIGHSLIYDLVRIKKYLGVTLEPYFDTILAHYSFDEERGSHGLKQLAAQEFDAPDWEGDLAQYLQKPATDSYAWLPRKVLYEYCAQDGIYTWMLYELFSDRLRKPENEDLHHLFYDFLMPAVPLCIEMQLNGIHVDTSKLALMFINSKTQEDAEEATLQGIALRESGLASYNPRSAQQTSKILYDVLGAPVWSKSRLGLTKTLTETGGDRPDMTTCKAQLLRLSYHDELPKISNFAKHLLAYREAKHLRTHYLDHFQPLEDGRIHPQFSLFASVTGRLASTDPNVMNMSHTNGIRGVPCAEPGNVLVTVDYSQHELRVAAMLSGDETLRDIYRSGKDIHNTVATWFYGEHYTKVQRVIAKSFVFGLLYGRGWQSIADSFGISKDEALEKMHIINSLMPTFDAWREEQFRRVLKQGYVTTPTGRRRRFPVVNQNNENEIRRYCVNAPIQGLASDIQLLAMMRVREWISNYGGLVLMPLHDSGIYEVPEENKDVVASQIVGEMQAIPREVFGSNCIPFIAEADFGHSLDESKLLKVETDQDLVQQFYDAVTGSDEEEEEGEGDAK